MKKIEGRDIQSWKDQFPLLNKLVVMEELLWFNPNFKKSQTATEKSLLTQEDVWDAEERLKRFAPYIAKVFPETEKMNGIIEMGLQWEGHLDLWVKR